MSTAPLVTLLTAITAFGGIVAALFLARGGFDYIMARGNPRNRDQAHNTLIDVGKGVALLGLSLVLGYFLANTLKW
jgi:hypothetical protein